LFPQAHERARPPRAAIVACIVLIAGSETGRTCVRSRHTTAAHASLFDPRGGDLQMAAKKKGGKKKGGKKKAAKKKK
jgi:hypothetical protein